MRVASNFLAIGKHWS